MRKLNCQIVLVLAFVFSTLSHAAEYSWNAATPSNGQSTFADTPWNACKKYFDVRVNINPGSTPRDYHPVRIIIKNNRDFIHAECKYRYYWLGHNETWHLSAENTMRINRHGNACPSNTAFNFTTGECGKDEQKGPPNSCASTGNPINIATGEKFQAEADHLSNIIFSRSYNSPDGLWRHNFSTYLRFTESFSTVTPQDIYASIAMHHGRESFFTFNGTTTTPTSSDLGELSKTTTGWQFLSTENERFTFDTVGNLTHWSNTNGASQQFVRNGNQVTVTDNLGNSLSLTEDADRQPLSMTAPGVQITYTYNANKRLTSVSRTVGGVTTQRQYHYEDARNNALLTGITDERGVRYATWSYDDQGRAISSEHADGAERVTVAYNSNGTVSVTNELGKVANYSFQYIKGVKRITAIDGEPSPNCPSSNSTFTYDERGLLKTKTDNKGHLTTYTYNARGLETSRTEASGTAQARTITTDWHPILFLPIAITEPDRVVTYDYDELGRQLNRTAGER